MIRKGTILGSVVSITISEGKGKPRRAMTECNILEGFGIEGDAHGGTGMRQISLLGIESKKKIRETNGKGLCLGRFVENITTQGWHLYELPLGSMFWVGDALHEITQIGKECHPECEILQETGGCIMPKEGVFAKVIKGGSLKLGDGIYEAINQDE